MTRITGGGKPFVFCESVGMKLEIRTFLIPSATLILPGCAQLLQGRFLVGLLHAATAALLFMGAFFLPYPWGGILAASLGLVLAGWSAFDAWRWEHDRRSTQPVAEASLQAPGLPQPWYRRYLPVAVLGVLQAVVVGEIIFMMMMAAFAVMVFDAPGSEKKTRNWVFFIGLSLLPVVATALSALAWGLYRRNRPWWAVAVLAGVVSAGVFEMLAILGPGSLW